MTRQYDFIRLSIAVAVLLASAGVGVGAVAAEEVNTGDEDKQPVDLTDLLEKETAKTVELIKSEGESTAALIERILSNGVAP